MHSDKGAKTRTLRKNYHFWFWTTSTASATHNYNSSYENSATSNSVQSKVQTRFVSVKQLSMKVSSKNKVQRIQLSLKSSMGFRKFHSGFIELTKIHPMRTIPLAFKCSVPESLLMHSCIQTDEFRLIPKRIPAFSHLIKRNFDVLQIYLNSSPSCNSMYKCLWLPHNRSQNEHHLTASTKYHCNVLSHTIHYLDKTAKIGRAKLA